MNLVTEQHLADNKGFRKEPPVLSYYEESRIIAGRNQNAFEEINHDYIKEHSIRITRHLLGDGAVYQDSGNPCLSFVVPSSSEGSGDFKPLIQSVANAPHQMGATSVEVSDRNDILIDGKKFSGNAMYPCNGEAFPHGTSMLGVDLSAIADALHAAKDKTASKGIKPARSRVTNPRLYSGEKYQGIDVPTFGDELLKGLFHVDDLEKTKDKQYVVTPEGQKEINKFYG